MTAGMAFEALNHAGVAEAGPEAVASSVSLTLLPMRVELELGGLKA